MKNLYLNRKFSSYEIAKTFNCSQTFILKQLKKYYIETRSIQEAKSLMKPRYLRKNFSGNLKEKSYLIGFRLGDLHVSKTHPDSPTIRISTNTTKREQIELMKKMFCKYGHVKEYSMDKNGAISVRAFVNNSFSFLVKKADEIEPWILKNKLLFKFFLAGYIDAEGCFTSKHNLAFLMNTQDKNIMRQISTFLNKNRIKCMEPKITRHSGSLQNGVISNRDVWSIYIYNKENVLKLIKFVGKYIRHRKRKFDMMTLYKYLNVRS